MYRHAAKSAAQPNSSLKAPMAAESYRERNSGYSMPPFDGAFAARKMAAIWANFKRRDRESDFGASGSPPSRIPSSAWGHASGPNRRPAARRRSASLTAPFRVSVPPKRSLRIAATNAAQTSVGPRQESTPWHTL